MITRFFENRRPWENVLDLVLLAAVARIPGLMWGHHWFSHAPFTYLSYDEMALVKSILAWLSDWSIVRKDYVYGYVRQIELVLPIARWVGDAAPPLTILFAARLSGIVLGSATAGLTYVLARLYRFDRFTACLAGGFLALAPLHVTNSHYATPTASFTFWVMLCFAAFLIYLRDGRWPYWLLGCAAAGTAAAVKFGFFCAIPLVYVLFRTKRNYPLMMAGLVVCAASFLYFNYDDFPLARFAFIEKSLISDNFVERVHARWINPFMMAVNLLPSLGLPAFACAAAGFAGFWKRAEPGAPTRADRFFCVELPLILYVLALFTMTSVFTRHLVLLLPFLCLVAAAGFPAVAAKLEGRVRDPRAALLVFFYAYQAASVAWLAGQHLTNRVHQGLTWMEDNIPQRKKIYVAERHRYDLDWKERIPKDRRAASIDEADYALVTEKITWRFQRSALTPLTADPRPEEIYHHRHMKDPEVLDAFAHGRAPFRLVARFPAREIIPEFILYKRLFHTFNVDYGDVSVYERLGGG